jgi:hypothetical protein
MEENEMGIQVVTIRDYVIPVSEVDFAKLLGDYDTIHFYPGVPHDSAGFGEWLEAWHREHNPDLFAFTVTSAGEQLCTKG